MTCKKKRRLFLDMDGTLAEWRNIVLKIENYEQKENVLKKLNEILLSPGYFLSLAPHENVVQAVREIAKEYDTYILSCAMEKNEKPNPSTEKREWLGMYVPEIDDDHIIFVPDGKNKADYIPGGVREDDVIVDDLSKNLRDFEKAGGVGIKLLNDINESKGTWRGNTLSKDEPASKIVKDLRSFLNGEVERIRHDSPTKDRTPYAEISEYTVIDR